ncbi:MAG: hypothetical protein IJR14_05040, partial [Synergistaceae bacterium]|nr:hypothetical protein [Synergistaceae bacterium]
PRWAIPKESEEGRTKMGGMIEELMMEGEARGIEKGEARGRKEGRLDIISRMLGHGMSPQQVADVTALPVAEILACIPKA